MSHYNSSQKKIPQELVELISKSVTQQKNNGKKRHFFILGKLLTYKNDSTAIRIQGKLDFYLCPT